MKVKSLKLRAKSLICHSRENGNPLLYDFPLLRAQHLDSCLRRNDRKLVARHSPIHRFTYSPIHPFTNSNGFTLIETIMVMVIAVILAAVVAVRWSPFDTIKLNSATRKVAGDIRYAQKVAISTQTRAAISFTGTSYGVYQNFASTIFAPSPGDPCSDSGGNFQVDFSAGRCSNYSGVTISTTIPSNRVEFNSLGTPYGGDSNPLTSPNNTVIVSGAGADPQTITIEQSTGMVSY